MGNIKEVLEEILKELEQAKKDSLKSKRTGDYRIGLAKAERIVKNKLLINVVSSSICECGYIAFKEMEDGKNKCSICNKEF